MVDETRDETTIANSSEPTQDEIKALARADTETQLGVTVTRQSDFSTHTGAANPHGTTTTDIGAAEQEAMTAAEQDILVLQNELNLITKTQTFNMSVGDDSLAAAVAAVTGTAVYTHHQITYDDTTPPTLADGAWVTGEVLVNYAIPDWLTHTYYLWIKDATTVTQIDPVPEKSDLDVTTPGLVLVANDTAGPVWASNGLTMVDNAYTIIAPADAGSGLTTTETYDIYVDGAPAKTGFIALTGSITLASREEAYTIIAYAKDNQGNSSASNTESVTISGDVTYGVISFLDDDLSKTIPEDQVTAEDIGVIRASPATATAYVRLSTIDDTAIEGTNYYGRGESDVTGVMTRTDATYGTITLTDIGLSTDADDWMRIDSDGSSYGTNYTGYVQVVTGTDDTVKFLWSQTDGGDPGAGNDDDGTISTVHTGVLKWLDGATGVNYISVMPKDASSTVNNQFFVVIDYENRGAEVDPTEESMRFLLTASSATGDAGFQMATTDPWWVVMQAESYTGIRPSIATGRTGDQWILTSPDTRQSNDARMDSSSGYQYGEWNILDARAHYLEYQIAVTQAAIDEDPTFAIWMRAQQTGSGSYQMDCHPVLLQEIVSISTDGATHQVVTTKNAHNYNNDEYAYFEGTSAYEIDPDVDAKTLPLTEPGQGFKVSSVTSTTFEIANTGLGAESSFDPPAYVFGEYSFYGLAIEETQLGELPAPDTSSRYIWHNGVDGGAGRSLVEIPVAGSYKLRIYSNDQQFKIDKIVLGPDNPTAGIPLVHDALDIGLSSSSNLDEKFGPEESTYSEGGSGTPVDNGDNTVSLPYPLPDALQIIPDPLPSFDSTGLSTTVVIKATFTGMTGLKVNDFYVVTPSDVKLEGTTLLTSNTITFNQAQPLANTSTYVPVLTGRVTLADGTTVRQIDDGSRNIVTIGAEGSGLAVVITDEVHGYSSDDRILLRGNDLAAHNGIFTISNAGGNTFYIPMATGTAAATTMGTTHSWVFTTIDPTSDATLFYLDFENIRP